MERIYKQLKVYIRGEIKSNMGPLMSVVLSRFWSEF